MTDTDKAKALHAPDPHRAKSADVKKIGEYIDTSTQGAATYNSYSKYQNLGRPAHLRGDDDQAQFYGMEAFQAAIAVHPEIADLAGSLLKVQANDRDKAVQTDIKRAVRHGEKLTGLPPVAVVGGKVQMGKAYIADVPPDDAVKAQIAAQDPKLTAGKRLDDGMEKLETFRRVMSLPATKANLDIGEAASNASNALRDALSNVIPATATLTHEQKKIMLQGAKAEHTIVAHLAKDKSLSEKKKGKLEHRLEATMDMAAAADGIDIANDVRYKHYKEKVLGNVDAGLEAINTLQAAGVKPTKDETGVATYKTALPNDKSGPGARGPK